VVCKFNSKFSNFLAIILFVFLFTNYQSWSAVEKVKAVPPGFGYVDYEGVYVVDSNRVYTIEGFFVIFGSLLVKDNATLILRNADVQIFRPEHYEPPTIKNMGKLVLENSRISADIWGTSQQGWKTVTGGDNIVLEDYAELNISKSSRIHSGVIASYKAKIYVQDSSVDYVKSSSTISIKDSYAHWLKVYGGASLSITNSSVYKLICGPGNNASFVSITNSQLDNIKINCAKAKINIQNSTIDWLEFDEKSPSSVSISNSSIGLSLTLDEKNLTWTVKPFFAKFWNIRRNTSLHIEQGNLTLTDTNLEKIALHFSKSSVFLLNSKLYALTSESSKVHIIDSSFEEYLSLRYSSVFLSDSTLKILRCCNSNVTIVNSIAEKVEQWNDSLIEIWWHLKVVINDQIENPKPNTLVKVCDGDGRLVEQKIVNSKGLTQFTLIEKRINGNETAFLGKYTIYAVYDSWSTEKQITLQDSQTIFLTVIPFHIRLVQFISTPMGITVLIAIFLLIIITTIILIRKRQAKTSQNLKENKKLLNILATSSIG